MSLPARLLLPALLASLIAPGLLVAHPAHAGRASACKAPPFAVPKETQRAVDAAIDARVTGTAAGGLSSTVETRIDYETTTLSQDAAARSWVEYTLCLKLAKKLISQELHDELLRSLLAPQGVTEVAGPVAQPAVDPVGAAATPSTAPTADAVLGTWQVTSRYIGGSCPGEQDGRTTAYTWLVSQVPGGGLEIAVQGQTSFPLLRGTYTEGRLWAGGPVSSGETPTPTDWYTGVDGLPIAILSRAEFNLELVDGELVGTRDRASWSARKTDDERGRLIELCLMHYEVRARR